ncbi:methyltransferase domain-containing protein [Agrilactobacillus fermenti]|uniref:methyltransferase domain-containing protein n=1 Tax=Agrilactobacillus fermenti TaxID=2586909 RepID=UPI001E60C438|nr:methyltransferase domain-containing protein [Agrilactobacillus fermenti]MCD2257269.1 methyltransferase domain-containing protein [Agrilactobacillus fermenti]
MKKNIMAHQFIQRHLAQLRCPFCEQPFTTVEAATLKCPNQHSFNISKKGSLFFLRAPVTTEYDTDMLQHRRTVIHHGLFAPVIEQLSQQLYGQMVIDAGCGEGSQIKAIAAQHSGHYFAFDISKPAIELATSGTDSRQDCLFFVGDLAHMPFADHQFSDVINFLSPANYQEFQRVLQKHGQILKIMPNARYLQELRQLVYPTGPNAIYDPAPVQNHFKAQYPQANFQKIEYQWPVPAAMRPHLFAMTPLTWVRRHDFNQIQLDQLTTVTVDLTLAIVKL